MYNLHKLRYKLNWRHCVIEPRASGWLVTMRTWGPFSFFIALISSAFTEIRREGIVIIPCSFHFSYQLDVLKNLSFAYGLEIKKMTLWMFDFLFTKEEGKQLFKEPSSLTKAEYNICMNTCRRMLEWSFFCVFFHPRKAS